MKTQKLIRKYRLVKPHERIQYGDWWNIKGNSIDGLEAYANAKFNGEIVLGLPMSFGWCSVMDGDGENFFEGELQRDAGVTVIYARFVDCVPAPQKKH